MILPIIWNMQGRAERVWEAWTDPYLIKIYADFGDNYVIVFDDVDPTGSVYGPITHRGYNTLESAVLDAPRLLESILKERQAEIDRLKALM